MRMPRREWALIRPGMMVLPVQLTTFAALGGLRDAGLTLWMMPFWMVMSMCWRAFPPVPSTMVALWRTMGCCWAEAASAAVNVRLLRARTTVRIGPPGIFVKRDGKDFGCSRSECGLRGLLLRHAV